MALELTPAQRDGMVAHARETAPIECCGLIGGVGDRALKIYRARNAEQSRVRYTIHPDDMLHAVREIEFENGWDTLAIYHSHPMSEAFPSPTDVKWAVSSGWDGTARFVIISLADPEQPVTRAFWLKQGRVQEEPINLTADQVPE